MNKPEVSIIIPACNEAKTIRDVILKIKDLYPDLRKVMRNNLSNNNVNSPFFGIQTLHPASDLHPSLTTDYKE